MNSLVVEYISKKTLFPVEADKLVIVPGDLVNNGLSIRLVQSSKEISLDCVVPLRPLYCGCFFSSDSFQNVPPQGGYVWTFLVLTCCLSFSQTADQLTSLIQGCTIIS